MNFDIHQNPDKTRHYRSWTRGVLWEKEAQAQVHRLLALPFIEDVCVMPDTHWGMGGPVGVAVKFSPEALIPAVIGVDIGCGMRAEKVDLKGADLTPEVCQSILLALKKHVPNGMTKGADRGSWGEVPDRVLAGWNIHTDNQLSLAEEYDDLLNSFEDHSYGHNPHPLFPLANGSTARHKGPLNQLGTLGTGNHFFEVSVDQNDDVWLVVHSGSRGAGNRIGDYFTRRAQELMAKWNSRLPDGDLNLAFLPSGTPEYDGYVAFMKWAQRYAYTSRLTMMESALEHALPEVFGRSIPNDFGFDIHHNYLDTDTLIARKGAVHMTPGSLGIIPGAMGRRSYIVRGLEGLKNSLNTCSHGAGRAMSRTAAKRDIPMERHQSDLVGLACNNSSETLDETPGSYKDIDAVIAAQSDLVEPVYILTAKVCMKGTSPKRK